jgi:hypothetical protein
VFANELRSLHVPAVRINQWWVPLVASRRSLRLGFLSSSSSPARHQGQSELKHTSRSIKQTGSTTKNAKKQPIKRWYYIDMQRALDKPEEREDAIIGVDENRRLVGFGGKVEHDLSTPELDFGQFSLLGKRRYCSYFGCWWNFHTVPGVPGTV